MPGSTNPLTIRAMDEVLEGWAGAEVYRRAFEDSTDAILVTDVQGCIRLANPAWLRLHGFEPEEVLGRTPAIVKGPHTSPDVYEEMWQAILDPARGSWRGELVNRRKDGTEVPVLLTISPIRNGAAVAGYLGRALDLRERKAAEEFRRLHDLVVWHDLKSPLGVMLNVLELVLGGAAGEPSPRQRELLGRALRQGQRMQELIATSLDIEKLKARKPVVDLEPVELVGAVREALEDLQALARGNHVMAVLRFGGRPATPDDRLWWELDALHLRRCLDNLVKNAIEASPVGGEVTVTVASVPGGVRLRVENGGPPLPAEVRATLFHPFGTYGKRGGTGLGLYGVKLLVEAMGGAVRCESGEAGTAFELAFPAASAAADR
jgi:PAS domain S-box-containing protein